MKPDILEATLRHPDPLNRNSKPGQDDGTAEEPWSTTITADELLARMPNLEAWDPLIIELIQNIPNKKLTSWQLRWRDLQPKWASPGAPIVQLGDSAHAFIPSSIMGAATALEDAQSLPERLRLAGKKNVNTGTKVYELLRYHTSSPSPVTGGF